MASITSDRFVIVSLLNSNVASERNKNFLRMRRIGVSSDWFEDAIDRQLFDSIEQYHLKFSSVPSRDIVFVETGVEIPSETIDAPFDYWLHLFIEARKDREIGRLAAELQQAREQDNIQLRDEIAAELAEVTRYGYTDRIKVSTYGEVVAKVIENRDNYIETGVTSRAKCGFSCIDDVSGGVEQSDLWVITGVTSAGKTYFTSRMALGMVLGRNPEHLFFDFETDNEVLRRKIPKLREIPQWNPKKVMYVSMEMTNLQIGIRNITMTTGLEGLGLRLGTVSDVSTMVMRESVRAFKEVGGEDRLHFVEGGVSLSPKDVLECALDLGSEFVFIDGAYLLSQMKQRTKQYESTSDMVNYLKRGATDYNLGIIATFQMNKKEKVTGTENIMGGQSIGQIATVALEFRDPPGTSKNVMSLKEYKELIYHKGRNGEAGTYSFLVDHYAGIITQTSGSEPKQAEYGSVPDSIAEMVGDYEPSDSGYDGLFA